MDDDAAWLGKLADIDRGLLEQLAAGHTVKLAAASEFLSLRTTNRRLTVLRGLARVESTADLVLLYRSWRKTQAAAAR